jgi:hypothetical protein
LSPCPLTFKAYKEACTNKFCGCIGPGIANLKATVTPGLGSHVYGWELWQGDDDLHQIARPAFSSNWLTVLHCQSSITSLTVLINICHI